MISMLRRMGGSSLPMKRLFRRRRFKHVLDIIFSLNRHYLSRVATATVLTWIGGAWLLHVAEGADNPEFATFTQSLFSVWILLFSGLNEPPHTVSGQLLIMALLAVGVGIIGLFTASVASILVERYLRSRQVSTVEMDDHLVLCNWAPRALDWIREVHSKIIQQRRSIVIIHDQPDEIDLPDKQDEPAFNDVFIVKGDPTNEVVLRRAKVQKAYSVIVLTDEREGKHADGKTILICVAVRNICGSGRQPNLSVECANVNHRQHLRKAGADEIISSNELSLRLLARTSLFHGMTRVYQELLTVSRDANEIYLIPAPQWLVNRNFVELSQLFNQNREDRRTCLLIGIERGEEMMLNPVGGEAGPLRTDDRLILLSRFYPELETLFPELAAPASSTADGTE